MGNAPCNLNAEIRLTLKERGKQKKEFGGGEMWRLNHVSSVIILLLFISLFAGFVFGD
jgi:hypothetical protein